MKLALVVMLMAIVQQCADLIIIRMVADATFCVATPGPGFLAVFARRLGAAHVTMTDQAPLFPLMCMNAEDNDIHVELTSQPQPATADGNSRVETVGAVVQEMLRQGQPAITRDGTFRVVALDWNEQTRQIHAPRWRKNGSSGGDGGGGGGKGVGEDVNNANSKSDHRDHHDGEFDVILCSDLIYSGYERDPCAPLRKTLNRYE